MTVKTRRLLGRTVPIVLAFAGEAAGLTTTFSFGWSSQPGALVLRWVTIAAAVAAAGWIGFALRRPPGWRGWLLIGGGLVMLVTGVVVFGCPLMSDRRVQTGLPALIAALFFFSAGAVALSHRVSSSAERV